MSDTKITIIDNINGELRRHGLTQDDLCMKLGIDRKTFGNWQKRGEIPGTKLIACAHIFGCSLDYLARDVSVS